MPHVCLPLHPLPPGSLFELDLHGLHSQEAVAALEHRITLLNDLLSDPATAAAAAAAGGAGSGAGGAAVRRLRVVVGRGLHSSGGEASIPRVVHSHLAAAGLRWRPAGAGAVDVQLRRHAAPQPQQQHHRV